LRGLAAGAFTASLAVAAHGVGGGAAPTSGVLALLAVLAAGITALIGSWEGAGARRVMFAVLAVGQLIGHLMLSIDGHHMTSTTAIPPAAVMLTAHLVAILVGVALVAAAEHCYRTLSAVIRAVVIGTAPLAVGPQCIGVPRRAHRLHRELLIAASISHRGPPVSAVR